MPSPMTAQEVFETVARHLFAQGKQAMAKLPNGVESCAYRAHDGKGRCAVGVLIPDEIYDPKMEGNDIRNLLNDINDDEEEVKFPQLSFLEPNQMLLAELQDVHDSEANWHSSETMRNRLHDAARDFDLDAKFLTNLSFSDR